MSVAVRAPPSYAFMEEKIYRFTLDAAIAAVEEMPLCRYSSYIESHQRTESLLIML
jgi:hypothetical protein